MCVKGVIVVNVSASPHAKHTFYDPTPHTVEIQPGAGNAEMYRGRTGFCESGVKALQRKLVPQRLKLQAEACAYAFRSDRRVQIGLSFFGDRMREVR